MGILDKLVGKDVDAFAAKLVEMVAKRYPPALDQAKEKRV
jgi:DNA-binding ferritin-like protein (Dps family)